MAGNRRETMGDARPRGIHVFRFGYEPYRFIHARPWWVRNSDQSDWHEYHCCVFLDPSWGRDLCCGWWHAVYAAL